MSDNGAGNLHQMSEGMSMTASWSMPQVQQFYGEMARRLSAVMVLLDTIPITEMQAVNVRLRAAGVLSLPAEVSGDQARQWLINLQRDHDLYDMLLKVLAQVKGQ